MEGETSPMYLYKLVRGDGAKSQERQLLSFLLNLFLPEGLLAEVLLARALSHFRQERGTFKTQGALKGTELR